MSIIELEKSGARITDKLMSVIKGEEEMTVMIGAMIVDKHGNSHNITIHTDKKVLERQTFKAGENVALSELEERGFADKKKNLTVVK